MNQLIEIKNKEGQLVVSSRDYRLPKRNWNKNRSNGHEKEGERL